VGKAININEIYLKFDWQVGYGDIHCTTTLGRTFIVLFILVGLVSNF